jgi:hypothetical protein
MEVTMQHAHTIIRAATAADSGQLWRLSHLNGTRRLRGTVLVADQDGAVVAAIELTTGAVIAEPSHPDEENLRLLRRWRYLALRQGGGGARARALVRHPALRLAA